MEHLHYEIRLNVILKICVGELKNLVPVIKTLRYVLNAVIGAFKNIQNTGSDPITLKLLWWYEPTLIFLEGCMSLARARRRAQSLFVALYHCIDPSARFTQPTPPPHALYRVYAKRWYEAPTTKNIIARWVAMRLCRELL